MAGDRETNNHSLVVEIGDRETKNHSLVVEMGTSLRGLAPLAVCANG